MKVVRSGKSRKYQIECLCTALLEYGQSDIQREYDAINGCSEYIECPECCALIKLKQDTDEDNEKILTIDNIVFPNDFDGPENAKKSSDEDVTSHIKKLLKDIRNDEDDWTRDEEDGGAYRFSHCGDTLVLVAEDGDEYEIYVGKKIYNTYVRK